MISFMQGIFAYIPETNYVPREYSVAAILLLLFMVLISLVSVPNLLYFYISTFRSIIIIIIIIIITVNISPSPQSATSAPWTLLVLLITKPPNSVY